jgi:catechol 2,3-dioxygenase-like lactoylglutathione lyase family enzyme
MTATPTRPQWRGINHLALVTPDMDKTVRFYHGVLGMPLVATLSVGPMRHYFFEMGEGNTVAFFEWEGEDIPTFSKPAGIPPSFPAQFDHLSFDLPDERALHDLQERLRAAGVEVTDVVDHDFIHSVYFTDPNGIALEASYWLRNPTTVDGVRGEPILTDEDPVPAVREIVEAGEPAWTPKTELVDEGVDPA